jgi:hypothetical protein
MGPKKPTKQSAVAKRPAAADNEMNRALNLFIRSTDNLMRAYICYGFLRFLDERLQTGEGLEEYDVQLPSDGFTSFVATIDLRGATNLADVLAREIVWQDASRRVLSGVTGAFHQVRYWASLFETYRCVRFIHQCCMSLTNHLTCCNLATGILLAFLIQALLLCCSFVTLVLEMQPLPHRQCNILEFGLSWDVFSEHTIFCFLLCCMLCQQHLLVQSSC